MEKFISLPENLIIMMNLLNDARDNIKYESFHIFKIFVANPNKTNKIREILTSNKELLIEYFNTEFKSEKSKVFNDPQLISEVDQIKKHIKNIDKKKENDSDEDDKKESVEG